MSKALAIDFSTSNTGYAFRNPLTNEYVVGSIAGGKSKCIECPVCKVWYQ